MSAAAAGSYVGGLVLIFGVRTWLHVRRTGDTGFRGISGTPGSLRWWAGVLFVLALFLGVAASVLTTAGAAATPDGPVATVVAATGLCVAVLGFAGVLAAQSGMGTSWRIGVDEKERTGLVTEGLFSAVRNPIFTAMIAAQAGIALMVPAPLSAAALVCLVIAAELQVRLIEEPHLLNVHGPAYQEYASTTGRFLPGIGRLTWAPQTTGASR